MSNSHAPRAGRGQFRSLAVAFGLVVAFMVVEAIAGSLSGSLALLSDAGHMATDALGLGMALASMAAADRMSSRPTHTYGLFRLEILAALANAVLLAAVAGYVIYEAIRRFGQPPEVATIPMLTVAVAGLVVNIVGWRLLRAGVEESLNVRGAYLEMLADLAGSVGVILAALIMIFTGWPYVDPIFASLIGLFILPRAFQLGREALRIIVQAAPPHVDLDDVRSDLGSIRGVVEVHDLHVWTLTSEMEVATAHLVTDRSTDPHPLLDSAQTVLRDRYGIGHATLQVEPDAHQGCVEASW